MHRQHVLVIVFILLVAAAVFYWFFVLREQAGEQAAIIPPIETPEGPQPASLGEQLLEKAQNPIKGEVPELAPVVNPIEGLYKNPFE